MPIDTENLFETNNNGSRLARIARGLFLLLIVSIGWMQPFFVVAGQSLTPSDFIFPFLALLWAISLLAGKTSFRMSRAFWLFAFYFFTMLVSSIFSADQRTSFVKLAGEAYLLGLAVIGFNLIDTELRIKQATLAWLGGAAVAVSIGLFTFVLFYVQHESWLLGYLTYHYGAVPVGNYPRISSVFVSASMFCNYLNVTAVLLMIALRKSWISQALFAVGFSAVIICSIFTISAGLGGIFFAIGIWIWFFSENLPVYIRRLALASGLSIAVAFVIVSFVALKPYQNAPYTISIPVIEATVYPSPRLLVWSETIATFRDNFFTGKGLNAPTSFVVFQNTEGTTSVLTDAHNIFLSVAAQNGVFSLVAMIGICVCLLWIGATGAKENDLLTGLTIAFLTAFVYQGLTGAFENARHLWLLIGLMIAVSKFGSRPE